VRVVLAALISAPLAAVAVPALAQGNPSTDQIIQSLKPSGSLLQGGTRGIRLIAPDAATPAPAPAAAPPHAAAAPPHAAASHPVQTAAHAVPAPRAAPSVNLNVEFATNSATLTPQARKTLEQLGSALTSQDLASYKFRIEGHTDTVGSPNANQALSQRRADAVADYLEQTFAIPASRLEASGKGEEGLVVPTPPQTPELRNRRVEIINIGA